QRTGQGTVAWSAEELEYITKHGKLPNGMVGHHINSVVPHEAWAGDPRNIKLVRGQQGNLAEHGGDFSTPTA
ncbi:hypothetical protein, partial [Pasteurella multocida]|uniref:hypothetical protein n=1 Tax=Pasteurella multocida TaxID=747 RepID=UPI0035E433C7